jgi:hypothetical protein
MSHKNISMPFSCDQLHEFWINISSFLRAYPLGDLWGLDSGFSTVLFTQDVSHVDSCHLIKSEKD